MAEWAPSLLLKLLGPVVERVVGGLGRGPKVILDGVHGAPLVDKHGAPIYDVTQVWFRNRSLRATAKDVSARIEFFDRGAAAPCLEAHGQWARTLAPGHVGFRGYAPATDITAGHTPVKLLAILKYLADSSAFAFAAENLHAYAEGRHPAFELPAGEYRMRVSLAGPDVDESFWFDVRNGGAGAQLVVAARDW